MPVQRPKFGKPVLFVSVKEDFVLWASAILCEDKSCGYRYAEICDGTLSLRECSMQPAPDNWMAVVGSLQSHGYIELQDAWAADLVPKGWKPPESLEGCGCIALSGQRGFGEQDVPPDVGGST